MERTDSLVSKLSQYVKTYKPQPNADHSDNTANVGIDVNMGREQGLRSIHHTIKIDEKYHFNFFHPKCSLKHTQK